MSKDLSIDDEIQILRECINGLNVLSKRVQAFKDFSYFEDKWLTYLKKNIGEAPFQYWRGADMQVIESVYGQTKSDWDKKIDLDIGLIYDAPCPSRFPLMLSGLFREISEISRPTLLLHNRFVFYDRMRETSSQLELSNENLSQVTVASTIIFNQIRLVYEWIARLEQQRQFEGAPTLLDLGWKYYFAFGRNVNHTAMLGSRRCPDAIFLGQARLKNHRFAIDQKGYATVISEEGAVTLGALWLISPEDKRRLDRKEGVNLRPPSYTVNERSISSDGAFFFGGPENVDAMIYISNRDLGDKPADGYFEEIREGLLDALFTHQQIDQYLENFLGVSENSELQNTEYKRDLTIYDNRESPDDFKLPFFAYGVFKHGEFGFDSLSDHLKHYEHDVCIPNSCLLERDGLPLLCLKEQNNLNSETTNSNIEKIYGHVLYFNKGEEKDAYEKIARIEPLSQYEWAEFNVLVYGCELERVNCLIARKPNKGTFVLSENKWSLKHDNFFEEVIKFAQECIEQNLPTVKCQSAYLMLWTALERIAALKYSISASPMDAIENFGSDTAFIRSIQEFLSEGNGFQNLRQIYSTRTPSDKTKPSIDNHKRTVKYLYQVRSNITHRGKAGYSSDQALLNDCIRITLGALQNLLDTIEEVSG